MLYNIMRVLLLMIVGLAYCLDVQLQMEYENTLDYIIQAVKDNRLEQFDYQHYKKCVSLQCCVCGLSFKNQPAAALHHHLHHRQLLKYHPDIVVLFDQLVPSQQRYQFCKAYVGRWVSGSLSGDQVQEVCYVTSWNLFRGQVWVQVVKYILYIIVGLVGLVYYSEMVKPWK